MVPLLWDRGAELPLYMWVAALFSPAQPGKAATPPAVAISARYG